MGLEFTISADENKPDEFTLTVINEWIELSNRTICHSTREIKLNKNELLDLQGHIETILESENHGEQTKTD